MKSQIPTKSVLGDLLFLIENSKISYEIGPSYYITILHNQAANFTPPQLHV
jgi:hypothetical protein